MSETLSPGGIYWADATLRMLVAGFADYAETFLGASDDPLLRPSLALLRAGDARACVEALRDLRAP